jgi:hypothetical protein
MINTIPQIADTAIKAKREQQRGNSQVKKREEKPQGSWREKKKRGN